MSRAESPSRASVRASAKWRPFVTPPLVQGASHGWGKRNANGEGTKARKTRPTAAPLHRSGHILSCPARKRRGRV